MSTNTLIHYSNLKKLVCLNRQYKTTFKASIATFLLAIPTAASSDENVLVERVRYCDDRGTKNVCVGTATTPHKFKAWNDAGVSLEGQRNTYISIVNQPPRDQVRNVVFISSGQQTDPGGKKGKFGKGYPNVLTGQPNDYKHNCMNKTKSCVRPIDSKSLLGRIRSDGKFSDDDTLFIAAFDMRFGYFRSHTEKQKREDAYWNFITSKFDPEKVELIVLAGQSRGGCMMFRLGRKLKSLSNYQDIPLILQGFDPVCTTAGTPQLPPELPQLSEGVFKNPLNSNLHSYPIQIDRIFPANQREKLSILNIHGGGKVFIKPIRSFTWKKQDSDLGWWKQKWVNATHEDMGGLYEHSWQTVDLGITHIYDSLYKFGSTDFKSKAQHPVDINGDRLSDVILRSRHPQKGLIIHAKLSNGNGTFTETTYPSGDGNSVDKYPLLSGYFNQDNKTDLLLRYRDPQKGLVLRTKFSTGDGTFTHKDFVTGDNTYVDKHPAFIGDVNGDKLSDLILLEQHPKKGLHIHTKFSNGDGTFSQAIHKSGDGNMGKTLRIHAADINGDKKTDLIYHFQNASQPFEIRTQISNGDGSFTLKKLKPGGWWHMNNMQSFVGDVNRDKRSDLILITRDATTHKLKAKTFLSQGNGTFNRVIHEFTEGREVDKLEALVADIDGDRRTDILFRVRDPKKGLILKAKLSKGNGTYKNLDYQAGDGALVDYQPALFGNIDKGRTADLVLTSRKKNKFLMRTKLYKSSTTFAATEFSSLGNPALNTYPALTGAINWSGGATFDPCGGCSPTATTAQKLKVKNSATLKQGKNLTTGGKKIENNSHTIHLKSAK